MLVNSPLLRVQLTETDLLDFFRQIGGHLAFEAAQDEGAQAPGQARAEALKLAHELAALPQACMLTDRVSAYRQWDLPLPEALRQEGAAGYGIVLEEGIKGAARFAGGAGRHGGKDDDRPL